MKIVCAWCDKDLGKKPPYDNLNTTHGICRKCYKAVLKRRSIGQLLADWFDLAGLMVSLGLAAFLAVNFFYAYFSEDKLIDINSVGEANIEAILLPVVIIWGLVALIRVTKRWILMG